MKNSTFFRNSVLGATAILLSSAMLSCDDIASDDRYFEVEDVTPARNILIEDYTGQLCLNCPNAHEVMEALEEKYGDYVVPVSIHASGALALDRRRTNFATGRIGLGTPEGAYYYEQIGSPALPSGVINGSAAGSSETWTSTAKIQLTLPSTLQIGINPVADIAANEVRVDVELMPEENMEGQLMVWLLENGIVAQQLMPDKTTNREYVHNNVFRAAINGQDGETVTLTKDQAHHSSYSIELRDNSEEKWVAENLAVVAFLKRSGNVEQVKRAKVIVK